MPARRRPSWIAGAALLLALAAVLLLGRGTAVAWNADGGWDLNRRAFEYRLYSQGVYPNTRVAVNTVTREESYSIYPPFAFPLFAPVFAFGPGVPARLVFEALNLGGLAMIGVFAYRQLRFAGRSAALFAAAACLAMGHNSTAMALGQFSIISAGLLALQLTLLGQRRELSAGVAWALAMVKPQVGLAYAFAFLRDRHWRGLALGLAILAALSWWACAQTSVTFRAVLEAWFVREDYRFIEWQTSVRSSLWGVLSAVGISPRVALASSFVAAVLAGVPILLALLRRGASLLLTAGVLAILGRVCIYHRSYDNIMLFPALLALLVLAFERKDRPSIVVAAAVGVSVWVPFGALTQSVWADFALMATWLCAGGFLLATGLRPAQRAA